MNNWQIQEHDRIYDFLQKNQVNVGDTIEIMSNNQLGYKKYKVILDKNNNKNISLIEDWSMYV